MTLADSAEKLRAMAGALSRVRNVYEHRRGRSLEVAAFKGAAGVLHELAQALEDGRVGGAEARELLAALEGVSISAPTGL